MQDDVKTLIDNLLRIHETIVGRGKSRIVHPRHPDTWARWSETILDAAIALRPVTEAVEAAKRLLEEADARDANPDEHDADLTTDIRTVARAALSATVPGVVDGWQPIETAPKDGTAILITRPTEWESEERWHVVRWQDDCWTCHDGKFDTPLRGPDPTMWFPLSALTGGEQQ